MKYRVQLPFPFREVQSYEHAISPETAARKAVARIGYVLPNQLRLMPERHRQNNRTMRVKVTDSNGILTQHWVRFKWETHS